MPQCGSDAKQASFHGRSFNWLEEPDFVVFEEGSWQHLQNKPEYQAKKKADEISYGWDSVISRAHESHSPDYERIARELARPNRFQRRYLAKSFYDANVKAYKGSKRAFRRVIPLVGVTYCFLFVEDACGRKTRSAMLGTLCYVARGVHAQNTKVIGIASEKEIRPECSYDFCLVDMPVWTEKNQADVEELQKKTGMLTNPIQMAIHEDEYPG